MTVLVRPSTPADMRAAAAIYAPVVRDGTASFEATPPDAAEMTRRRAALVAGGYPYLVAEADLKVVGYAYAGPYRERAAYRLTVEDSIYVAAGHVGRGIGRALLAVLMRECEMRSFRQMVAVIGGTNTAASIALHAALGFRYVGVLEAVGHKHGRWLDTVLMQRALGPGAAAPPG